MEQVKETLKHQKRVQDLRDRFFKIKDKRKTTNGVENAVAEEAEQDDRRSLNQLQCYSLE